MTEKPSREDIIVSYNGIRLLRSDLDILSGQDFLNDRIIHFYFSYLSSKISSDEILLVDPTVAFLIKVCPNDNASLKEIIEPLNLHQKKIIILPINDNNDVTVAEGGNHWSLLVYMRSTNEFVHFDSSRGNRNGPDAEKVYKALRVYVSTPSSSSSSSSPACYVEYFETPKQDNGYDCGVYVLAFAKAICDWYNANADAEDTKKKLWSEDIKKITPSVVSSLRNEVLELVRKMMILTPPHP